jgi:hypothetical protein
MSSCYWQWERKRQKVLCLVVTNTLAYYSKVLIYRKMFHYVDNDVSINEIVPKILVSNSVFDFFCSTLKLAG